MPTTSAGQAYQSYQAHGGKVKGKAKAKIASAKPKGNTTEAHSGNLKAPGTRQVTSAHPTSQSSYAQ